TLTKPTGMIRVEVRSINNRHLKLQIRGTDPYPMMESEIEKIVRLSLKRGTLHISIRVQRQQRSGPQLLNAGRVQAYVKQLMDLAEAGHWNPAFVQGIATGVLQLPGIAEESDFSLMAPAEEWAFVSETLSQALSQLTESRRIEGASMARELMALRQSILQELDAVRVLIPRVVADYRERLLERIRSGLTETHTASAIDASQLLREIALYADRTDVSEEIVRLDAHLLALGEVFQHGNDGAGRRLDFMLQEIGRETNTLGSKAGDVAISRHVVEMKSQLERIRELVQNIE
ncbi:MAG: YicC family protein, partial [Gemmataceae bacterium]